MGQDGVILAISQYYLEKLLGQELFVVSRSTSMQDALGDILVVFVRMSVLSPVTHPIIYLIQKKVDILASSRNRNQKELYVRIWAMSGSLVPHPHIRILCNRL